MLSRLAPFVKLSQLVEIVTCGQICHRVSQIFTIFADDPNCQKWIRVVIIVTGCKHWPLFSNWSHLKKKIVTFITDGGDNPEIFYDVSCTWPTDQLEQTWVHRK